MSKQIETNKAPTNPYAITSFALSIVAIFIGLSGFFCSCLLLVAIACNILSIITGSIALLQIKTSNEEGREFALIGIILGITEILLTILITICGALSLCSFMALAGATS